MNFEPFANDIESHELDMTDKIMFTLLAAGALLALMFDISLMSKTSGLAFAWTVSLAVLLVCLVILCIFILSSQRRL
jgi:hypothetical protein